MRVVEKSSDHLLLSNAYSFWGKWFFVAAIVVAILVATIVCAEVMRPTWPGVAIGIFLLFMLLREIPRNFDRELRFDRPDNLLKVIERPWIGSPRQTDHLLSSITNVRGVGRARIRRPYRGWYPGMEDDIDASNQINSTTYYIELSFQSGKPLDVYMGDDGHGATQLAMIISEFLGLTSNPA